MNSPQEQELYPVYALKKTENQESTKPKSPDSGVVNVLVFLLFAATLAGWGGYTLGTDRPLAQENQELQELINANQATLDSQAHTLTQVRGLLCNP